MSACVGFCGVCAGMALLAAAGRTELIAQGPSSCAFSECADLVQRFGLEWQT